MSSSARSLLGDDERAALRELGVYRLVLPVQLRPAGPSQGRGQIPFEKAINYLIDRPQLVPAGGLLAGRRTDQLLPLRLSRSAAIYPTGGVTEADSKTARALVAKARFKPRRLVLYALARQIAAAQTL